MTANLRINSGFAQERGTWVVRTSALRRRRAHCVTGREYGKLHTANYGRLGLYAQHEDLGLGPRYNNIAQPAKGR